VSIHGKTCFFLVVLKKPFQNFNFFETKKIQHFLFLILGHDNDPLAYLKSASSLTRLSLPDFFSWLTATRYYGLVGVDSWKNMFFFLVVLKKPFQNFNFFEKKKSKHFLFLILGHDNDPLAYLKSASSLTRLSLLDFLSWLTATQYLPLGRCRFMEKHAFFWVESKKKNPNTFYF
jgi:hypothetical protein